MKDIYEILNDIDIDESDFEELKVDEIEEKRVMKKLKKTIRNKNGHKNKIIVAVVSVIAVTAALGIGFPSYARQIPLIGDIFKTLENVVYDSYKDSSSTLDIVRESNGIKITLNDAIFDGANLNITYTVESDKDLGEDIGFTYNFKIDGNNTTGWSGGSNFIKIDDNIYVGQESITMVDFIDNPQDSIDFKLNIDKVSMLNEMDEVEGKWDFNISLNATVGEQKLVNKSVEKNGVTVAVDRITINPMSTFIRYSQSASQEVKDKYNQAYVVLEIRDDLGNIYASQDHGATGEDEFTLTTGVTIEKIKEGAKQLIITPKVDMRIYSDVKYVDQEAMDGKTGEKSTGLAETYDLVGREEIILDDIVIDL